MVAHYTIGGSPAGSVAQLPTCVLSKTRIFRIQVNYRLITSLFITTKVSIEKSKPWIFLRPLTNVSNSCSVTFSIIFVVTLFLLLPIPYSILLKIFENQSSSCPESLHLEDYQRCP